MDNDFINQQIHARDLPSIEQVTLEGLDKNHLKVEYIMNGIFALILVVVISVLFFAKGSEWPIWIFGVLAAAALFLVLLSVAFTKAIFRNKEYALRDQDILYQSGLFWKKFTVLPFRRIQHAEVHQGPLDRMFDLAKLRIYTAGGSSSDMSIDGLHIKTAQSIKHFILSKNMSNEEE